MPLCVSSRGWRPGRGGVIPSTMMTRFGVPEAKAVRSLEAMSPNTNGSRQSDRGYVTQRSNNAGEKSSQEGLTTAAT